MIFCKELDLPAIPDELVNYSLDIVAGKTEFKNMQTSQGRIDITKQGATVPGGYDRYIELVDNSQVRAANIERYPFSEHHFEWFEKYIFTDIRKCSPAQLSSQIIKNGTILQTHTDGIRGPFVLSYLIDSGGEQADTIWYQQHGHDVIREPRISIMYDQSLTEVFRYKVKPKSWVVMDARVLHGVRFMSRPRMMISVGFYHQELIKFFNQHGIENSFNLFP